MNINAQPGYVVIEFTPPEEKEAGHQKLDSGILVPEHVAAAQEERITHLEHKIIGVSGRSELKVGSMALTSKAPIIIEVCVAGKTMGIMPESEVIAHYVPEEA